MKPKSARHDVVINQNMEMFDDRSKQMEGIKDCKVAIQKELQVKVGGKVELLMQEVAGLKR